LVLDQVILTSKEYQINWRQAFVEVALIGMGVRIALAGDNWW